MKTLGVLSRPKDPLNVMLLHFDTDFSDSSIYTADYPS